MLILVVGGRKHFRAILFCNDYKKTTLKANVLLAFFVLCKMGSTFNCIAPCKQSALWAYLGHRQCHGPFPPSGTNPEDGFQVPYSAYRTIWSDNCVSPHFFSNSHSFFYTLFRSFRMPMTQKLLQPPEIIISTCKLRENTLGSTVEEKWLGSILLYLLIHHWSTHGHAPNDAQLCHCGEAMQCSGWKHEFQSLTQILAR